MGSSEHERHGLSPFLVVPSCTINDGRQKSACVNSHQASPDNAIKTHGTTKLAHAVIGVAKSVVADATAVTAGSFRHFAPSQPHSVRQPVAFEKIKAWYPCTSVCVRL